MKIYWSEKSFPELKHLTKALRKAVCDQALRRIPLLKSCLMDAAWLVGGFAVATIFWFIIHGRPYAFEIYDWLFTTPFLFAYLQAHYAQLHREVQNLIRDDPRLREDLAEQ